MSHGFGIEGIKSEAAMQLEMEAKAAAAQAEATDGLNDELQAMRSVARTLEKLPSDARQRVLAWLLCRFEQGYSPSMQLAGLASAGIGRLR